MRAMRIIVMFDLPTKTREEKKTYVKWRDFLLNDGFIMEQYSVYTRSVLDRNSLQTHLQRIENSLPGAGRIVVFAMTEKQYNDRKVFSCDSRFESSEMAPGDQMTLVL